MIFENKIKNNIQQTPYEVDHDKPIDNFLRRECNILFYRFNI